MLHPTDRLYKKALKACIQGKEVWTSVNVRTYDKHYQVSNMGHIKRHNKVSQDRLLSGIRYKYSDVVDLSYNRQHKIYNIDFLVLKSFTPQSKHKKYISHKNGLRHDNRIINLLWSNQLRNTKKFNQENKNLIYQKTVQLAKRNIEVWRPVDNCNQIYDISSFGRIRSWSSHGNKFTLADRPHLIASNLNTSGYYLTNLESLYKKNQYHCLNHRLVAKTFIPNPNNYSQVDHIDGCRTNNKITNLRWCTLKQNMNFSLHKKRIKLNSHHRTIALSKHHKMIVHRGSIRGISHWLQANNTTAHNQPFTTVLGRVEDACNSNCFNKKLYGFRIKFHNIKPVRTSKCIKLIKKDWYKTFISTRPAAEYLIKHTSTKASLKSVESAISSIARGHFARYYGYSAKYLSYKATNKFMRQCAQRKIWHKFGKNYIVLRRFREPKYKGEQHLVIKNTTDNSVFLTVEKSALSKNRKNLFVYTNPGNIPVFIKRGNLKKKFNSLTSAAHFVKKRHPELTLHGLQSEMSMCAKRNNNVNHPQEYPYKNYHMTHGYYVKYLNKTPMIRTYHLIHPTKNTKKIYLFNYGKYIKFDSVTNAARWLVNRINANSINSVRRDISNCCAKNDRDLGIHYAFGYIFVYHKSTKFNENRANKKIKQLSLF